MVGPNKNLDDSGFESISLGQTPPNQEAPPTSKPDGLTQKISNKAQQWASADTSKKTSKPLKDTQFESISLNDDDDEITMKTHETGLSLIAPGEEAGWDSDSDIEEQVDELLNGAKETPVDQSLLLDEIENDFIAYEMGEEDLPEVENCETGTFSYTMQGDVMHLKVKESTGVHEYYFRGTDSGKVVCLKRANSYPAPFENEMHSTIVHFIAAHRDVFKNFNWPSHAISQPKIAVTVHNLAGKADYGVLSRSEAAGRLQDSPKGTFLIRKDSGEPDATIISYVNRLGVYDEVLLRAVAGGFHDEDSGGDYPSLNHYFQSKTRFITPYVANPEPASPGQVRSKREYSQEVRDGLTDCKLPQELFKQALLDGEAEAALWLMQEHGATLEPGLIAALPENRKALAAWLQLVSANVVREPQHLDHYALNVGYGYKSANLLMLEKKTADINLALKTATVKVPPFLPVSDFELSSYLFRAVPQIPALWSQFLNSFDNDQKAQFMQRNPQNTGIPPLKISPQGQAILAEIQRLVVSHFTNHCYSTLQIEDWLMTEKPELVIVRSTGREDSENNSNAGGNASIPFVAPDSESISEAIGEVLSSYFGEKSIGQRLLSGDQTLFTEAKPFLPVLLQKMILESGNPEEPRQAADIPRSGVLFTSQKDKARGVTFIQAGLGNNEGVVSSQVAVDSYYVDAKGHVHSIVRDKKTRFVSVRTTDGKEIAAQIENQDQTLNRGQAVPVKVVRDLKRVADAVSLHYSQASGDTKALDMEYTVKMNRSPKEKPVIYLLQARPLIESDAAAAPTYLDLEKLEKIQGVQKANATVLVDIHNHVREIKDPGEVIFADTLPRALETYMQAENPQQIKAVFVRKSAPSTSHEAVMLRPKGIAVIYVEDKEAYQLVKKMAGQAAAHAPMLIDTQRALVAGPVEQSRLASLEVSGQVSYPAPREVSIPIAPIFQRAQLAKSDTELKQIIEVNRTLDAALYERVKRQLLGKNAVPAAYMSMSIQQLLDIVAAKEENEAKPALAALLTKLHSRLKKNLREVEEFRAPYNIPLYNVYRYALTLADQEILPALKDAKGQSLERLYPLKFLEAAIFQLPDRAVVLGSSYARALGVDRSQREDIQSAQKAGITISKKSDAEVLKLYHYGVEGSLNEKTAAAWKRFVKSAQQDLSAQEIARMNEMLGKLQDFQLLHLWLSLNFMPDAEKDAAKTTLSKLDALLAANQSTLDWVKNNRVALPKEAQLAKWQDPAYVKKELPRLKALYTGQFGMGVKPADPFDKRMLAASPFARLALLQFFNDAITTYDTVIKQISGSAEYPEDRRMQAADFAGALEGYYEMMQCSFNMLTAVEKKKFMQTRMRDSEMKFESYAKGLRLGRAYRYGFRANYQSAGFEPLAAAAKADQAKEGFIPKEQFKARPEFNVSAVKIGSGADMNFSVIWPTTLEEYFTTFHQNMDAVRKHLLSAAGVGVGMVSEQVQDVCQIIENRFSVPVSGISENDEGKVEVDYQIPVRQHAGSIKITYDPKAPEKGYDIALELVGNHEHDRWYQAAFIGAWMGCSRGMQLTGDVPPEINWSIAPNSVSSVRFSLHPGKVIDLTKLESLIAYTFDEMTQSQTIDIHKLMRRLNVFGPLEELDPKFFRMMPWQAGGVLEAYAAKQKYSEMVAGLHQSVLGLLEIPMYRGVRGECEKDIGKTLMIMVAKAPELLLPVLTELLQRPGFEKTLPLLSKMLREAKTRLLFDQANHSPDAGRALKAKLQQMAPDAIVQFYKELTADQKQAFKKYFINDAKGALAEVLNEETVRSAARFDFDLIMKELMNESAKFLKDELKIVALTERVLSGALQDETFDRIKFSNVKNTLMQFLKNALVPKGEGVREAALKAIENLIADYVERGRFGANAETYKTIAYSLTQAYSKNNPMAAAAYLPLLWGPDTNGIEELKNNYNVIINKD